jgi:DNA-binding transcriptional ArsR family regulator
MSYGATLEMLADPTRRSIVEKLRVGPWTVQELADALPVSRPAVSKHLRLMLEAGVVKMHADGTRHFYEIDLKKIDEVRRYLDGFWDAQLARFKDRIEKKGEWRHGRDK